MREVERPICEIHTSRGATPAPPPLDDARPGPAPELVTTIIKVAFYNKDPLNKICSLSVDELMST